MKNRSYGPLEGVRGDRVNVLYITSLFAKMGGAEKNIFDMACNIDKGRFTPHVICFKGGELVEDLRSRGIDAKILYLEKLFSLEAVGKGIDLFKFIKRRKIEVVVTYHHDADIWGGLIAKLAGVPVIISSRRDIGYQLRRKHVWAYRILNRFFTKIVSVSEAVKNEIVRREWTSPDKIVTVYNGVSFEDCGFNKSGILDMRESLGIGPDKKVIGMLGAFRPIKGHACLVDAVAKIAKSEKDFTVLIIGYRETEYYKEVQRLISRLGLEGYFICTGDRDDISRMLAIFDIFVLPSISEGFSNALLEAMAAGKPAVVTNAGGNPEAVMHNKTGLLVPSRDSAALSAAIQRLLYDEELRQSMGREGQIRAARMFNLRKMVDNNEELYEFLVKKKKERNPSDARVKTGYAVKKSVKLLLSHLLYYSGITSACKKKSSKRLKVLAYHSINSVSLRPLEMEQDVSSFERQMVYLKNNFRLLSLSEFFECRNNGGAYPENAAMVTFDDGYRDNYINAYPILKEHNIPATVFLTTGPLETGEPLFFDALRYAITNTSRLTLDLRDIGLERYMLDSASQFMLAKVIKDITDSSKGMDPVSKAKLVHDIYDRLRMDTEEMKKKRMYLSWSEVSEMAANGIEFGSHTVSHPQLLSLPFEECKDELVRSKKIIEKRIGGKVKALAYPFGGSKDFNVEVERAAREAGYECAFSLCQDRENNSSFTTGRRMVDSHMSSTFSGGFCKPLFEADIAEIYSLRPL
jgi:glycosyltransferase involved in cell wall biosynthesis/peptidoglycan/xylan/chitin deacetylase (PgdA/CDA1 family)